MNTYVILKIYNYLTSPSSQIALSSKDAIAIIKMSCDFACDRVHKN